MKKLILGLFFITFQAQAGLVLSEYRVLFDDSQIEKEIVIKNDSETDKIYEISIQNLKQRKAGGYDKIEKSTEDFKVADKFLKISQNLIRLAPGEKEGIFISVPEIMDDGEYVSYLSILEKETPETLSQMKGFVIQGQLKTMIPVIVRRGVLESGIEIGKVKLLKKSQEIEVEVKRFGNKSIKGSIEVYQKDKLLAKKSIALYTVLKDQAFKLSMKGVDFDLNETIQVKLSVNEIDGEKLEVKKYIHLK
ncbi:MAG: hypothetical protein JXR30_01615 [Alphaproteobacteria bacterium]|nr:hypothetical protein [Alphaproteobacteria bacterium]